MRVLLYSASAAAVIYAATRVIWRDGDAERGVGMALIFAAICAGSGAIVDAIDRAKPKVVSADNGGGPRKDAPGG